jgi:hypothetical protein
VPWRVEKGRCSRCSLRRRARELLSAGLVGRLQSPTDGATAAATAESIATLFVDHVAKENDLLLPALIDSGVDLAALLAGAHSAPTREHT